MKISQVEKILRSEGVALGGYSGNYEFWNMRTRYGNLKTEEGCWIGRASNLKQVMEQYKDHTDDNIHLLPGKMKDLVNRIDIHLP